ncbi:hypothetical protein RB195_025369 [Necator americanus]|uniref:Reverse transcriptase domain-containing protein n=1 Tax=Necator americanus TaxID=51031 RepID=A0ABR1ESM4_NECAM
MYKVLERNILDRLIRQRKEAIRDEQGGFRLGPWTPGQMFIVRRLIEAVFKDTTGKFVRLMNDMNRRTIAAVRTPAGCTTPFEVETGVRQGGVAGPFCPTFTVDGLMRRTTEQCPVDVILAPSPRVLVDVEYTDNVVIFASSSAKLQHVVNIVSKLAAYRLRLRLINASRCGSRPSMGIRMD